MVTQLQYAEYRSGQAEIDALVRRGVAEAWDSIGDIAPDRKRDLLLDIAPFLVTEYGPIAASLAAEFFAETVLLKAEIPEITTGTAMQQSARAVIGGLWTGQETSAKERLTMSVVRHVRQQGRDTIKASVRNNRGDVRFARILSHGSKKGPCAWCRLLASRGAVYHSEITAGGLDDWHDECRCDAVAVRNPDDFPPGVPGYDDIIVHPGTEAWMPKPLFDEYESVHEYLDDDRKVASKLRAKYGYT